MDLTEYLATWRRRWRLVAASAVLGVIAAAVVSALTQPLYLATARLFVTTTGGASVVEAYQGNLFGQERVQSYANLATGRQVAQRTVDQLGIDISADDLLQYITAVPVPNSVVLDISVTNPDPGTAADITNAVALQTSQLVEQLETSARGGSPAALATVVDAAVPPASPDTPDWYRNLAVGLVAGLLVGLVAAIPRDKLDRRVRDTAHAAPAAGAVSVGEIPHLAPVDGPLPYDVAVPTAADAFRDVRTRLLGGDRAKVAAATPGGAETTAGAVTVTVTAPDLGAGTSTVARGVAGVLAEAGRSVVLVEANLRDPSLRGAFGLPEDTTGLGEVLDGTAELDDVVHATDVANLSVLVAGRSASSPAESLGRAALGEALRGLGDHFEVVVLDAAPVRGHPDTAIIAASGGEVLLVARRHRTTTTALEDAAARLRAAGAPATGFVVNDVR